MGILHLINKNKIQKEISYNDKTFILCMESDLDKLMAVLCRKFNVDNSGDGRALEIHNNDITISLEVLTKSMGEEEDKFIKKQVSSICDHFYNVDTKHEDIKTNLIYTINLTKSMIFINYSFLDHDKEAKKAFVEQSFAEILSEIQGIMLIQDEKEDGMYCQSPDEKRVMELILSDKGKSTLLNYVPYEEFKITPKNSDITDDQFKRRERTRDFMLHKYIYVPASFPVIQSELKTHIRTVQEMAERAVAIMIVSEYAEYSLKENADYEDAYNFAEKIIKKYDADNILSPKEREFLNKPAPSKEELIAYAWQYESLFLMEWAIGLIAGDVDTDKLYFPNHLCAPAFTADLIKEYGSIAEIVKQSRPQSKRILLDECDFMSCLDWACIDTRLHEQPAPAGLNEGVVSQRLKALKWLAGSEWDKVENK